MIVGIGIDDGCTSPIDTGTLLGGRCFTKPLISVSLEEKKTDNEENEDRYDY